MLPFDTYKQSGFSFSISVFGFDIGLFMYSLIIPR